ncbi:MAG: hypothetical protein IJJ80_07080 [Clostridia bacterium]|nr:hypothetical protein [Clostridia bacterium]
MTGHSRFVLILCAAVLAISAAAAAAEGFFTEFDDFTLKTDRVLELQNERTENQPLFIFYPAVDAGIAMTAVNATWTRDGTLMTAEQFTQMYRDAESMIRAQYEAGGRKLADYDAQDAVEKELWGMKSLLCDAVLSVETAETSVLLYQRGIRVSGAFGTYLFSLSAWSQELLEEATEYLVGALEWK